MMYSKKFITALAAKESVSSAFLQKQVSSGRAAVLCNKKRGVHTAVAVGGGLKVKINTNIGLSPVEGGMKEELEKLFRAIEAGADTVMDLSVSPRSREFRQRVLAESSVPVGTVPVYEAALEVERRKGSFEKMRFEDIWDVLSEQAKGGVDFFTIHAGILRTTLAALKRKKRLGGIVSRGGAILARWMIANKAENPFFEHFDEILKLARAHAVTLSLGDALRPGAIADSSDYGQFSELRCLGKLVRRCRRANVQAMVEGPGHIRFDEIPMNMALEKKLCDNAPFYVLGPLPVDIAAGHDHITGAIGGAVAAFYGADFLCVVTPAEHLRHPSAEDIYEGTIASRIAAHCINVLRFKDEWNKNRSLSFHRSRRNWDKMFPLMLDEKKARLYRHKNSSSEDYCTMCGQFCSLKLIENCELLKTSAT